jgi:hypothetical protein
MHPSARNHFVYIKCTVTGAKIIEIGIPVITGADDVKVFLLFSRSEAARAGTVPVALLIFQQSLYEVFRKGNIRVQEITSTLCLFFQN